MSRRRILRFSHADSPVPPVEAAGAGAPWHQRDYEPPVYVISLARTPDRTAQALAELAPLGLPVTVVTATDGWNEGIAQNLPRDPRTTHPMQPGEVGLCMSWWRVAARIVRDDVPLALVFEDDVQLMKGAAGLREALSVLPAGCDFANLSDWQTPPMQPAAERWPQPWVKVDHPAYTTVGYAVTNAGARKLLAGLVPFSVPIDVWLNENRAGMQIAQVHPDRAFCTQNFWRKSECRASVTQGEIPKIIHRIWLGDDPMPEEWSRCCQTWREHHRWQDGWEVRWWDEVELENQFGQFKIYHPLLFDKSISPAVRADVWRLCLLHHFGGVYHDTDFECLHPLDALLASGTFIAADMHTGTLCNGFLACTPRHPWMNTMAHRAMSNLEDKPRMAGKEILYLVGPGLIANHLDVHRKAMAKPLKDSEGRVVAHACGDTGLVVTTPGTCFPYYWTEPRPASYGAAWMVHHWARSWWDDAMWEEYYQANPHMREQPLQPA